MSEIKKNFAYNSILTVAGYVFPLLTFPYVTRVLGVENIGLVNFIDSVINYLLLFSTMGLLATGIRSVASAPKNREALSSVFSNLVALTLISTFITLVALAVITFFSEDLRSNLDLVGVGAVKLVFNALLIEWFYKGIENFKFITMRSLAVKLLYVVAIFVFVRSREDALEYYIVSAGMIVANAVINFWYSRRFVTLSFRGLNLKKYLRPFLTMGGFMILSSTYSTLNVSILGFVTNETQVGYFTTATKLYGIILALFTAFTNVMLPRMSSLISEGRLAEFSQKIITSFRVLILFSIPVIVFAEAYASEIIAIIAGPGYEGAILPMRIVMLLVFVVGSNQVLVMQVLMPLNADRSIVINTAWAAGISLVLNALMVSSLQSVGSALVTISSEVLLMWLSLRSSRRRIEFKYPGGFVLKNILVYLPLLAILIGVEMLISNIFISIAVGAVVVSLYCAAMFFTVFRNEYLSRELRRKFLHR